MKNNKTKILVEGALMVALATVLSYLQVIKFPWGGSVTVLSMLPIILFALKYNVKYGLMISFIYSLIQFGQGTIDGLFGWGLTPGLLIGCILLDYIGAYTVLGLAGLWSKRGFDSKIVGTASVVVLRFLFHYVSGIVVFHSAGKLWEGFSTENTYLYSLLYNGAYMLPELIFTVIGAIVLLKIPQTKKFFEEK